MDTILITTESLKHLGDSVHVLMPTVKVALNDSLKINFADSVHTYQSVVKESDFWTVTIKDIIQILVAGTAAVLSYIAIRETKLNNKIVKDKVATDEKKRKDNLNKHLVTWLSIIKLEILRQSELMNEADVTLDIIYHNSDFIQATQLTFSFDKILELDKLDLTESFIINSSDPSSNSEKLSLLVSTKDDLQITFSNYLKYVAGVNDKFQKKVQPFRDALLNMSKYAFYESAKKDVFGGIGQLPDLEFQLKSLELWVERVEKYHRTISNGSDFEQQTKNIVENCLVEAKTFLNYVSELSLLYYNYEVQMLHCARNIELLEKYYNGDIDNKRYKEQYEFTKEFMEEEIVRDLYFQIGKKLLKFDNYIKIRDLWKGDPGYKE